ncbi:hypothetical protein VNO77_02898 [Canavalia gladiata]|uniref:Uncharacterized protein n=1 Tax=Canavalia gladiata TaxID=3824 RepID=A0AAN9MVV3_CANGL
MDAPRSDITWARLNSWVFEKIFKKGNLVSIGASIINFIDVVQALVDCSIEYKTGCSVSATANPPYSTNWADDLIRVIEGLGLKALPPALRGPCRTLRQAGCSRGGQEFELLLLVTTLRFSGATSVALYGSLHSGVGPPYSTSIGMHKTWNRLKWWPPPKHISRLGVRFRESDPQVLLCNFFQDSNLAATQKERKRASPYRTQMLLGPTCISDGIKLYLGILEKDHTNPTTWAMLDSKIQCRWVVPQAFPKSG